MRLAARHRNLSTTFSELAWDLASGSMALEGGADVVRMGRGEPIVMVPGMAGGWRLLTPLAKALARHHEVILIGLRGDTNFPGACPDQRPSDHARDLHQTLNRLGLERPTVLGVSYGAAVALELAVQEPARLGGLVLFGACDRFRTNLGSSIAVRALERFPLPRDSRFLNQFFNVLHGKRPEAGPMVDFIVNRCWETDQGVVASRLRGLESFSVGDDLWKIDVPTMVLAGSRDVVIPPSLQRDLCNNIAGAQFRTIEGAGHVGFVTHRAEIAKMVDEVILARTGSLC